MTIQSYQQLQQMGKFFTKLFHAEAPPTSRIDGHGLEWHPRHSRVLQAVCSVLQRMKHNGLAITKVGEFEYMRPPKPHNWVNASI